MSPQPILLAHSYYLQHDAKQVRKMKPYPPLDEAEAGPGADRRALDIRWIELERREAEARSATPTC